MQRLSSLKLTFWSLKGLCLLLALGVVLAHTQGPGTGIRSMSERLVMTWLLTESLQYPLVTIWFGCVVAVSALLFINLGFCIATRLMAPVRNGRGARRILLAAMHVAFGLVMAAHAVSLCVGFKHSNIKLFAGKSFAFGSGYRLELEKTEFIDDPALLRLGYRKARSYMTRERFHHRENRVVLGLYHNDALLGRGDARILHPFKCAGMQAAVTRFIISPGGAVGAMLVVTRNPLVGFFFINYALLIAVMAVYTVRTWRLPVPVQRMESALEG